MKCGTELSAGAEYLYHFDVITVGEDGVGKSAFLEKLSSEATKKTITKNGYSMSFSIRGAELVLSFKESSSPAVKFESDIAAASLIFDLTNRQTFIRSIRAVKMLELSKPKPIIYLVGNKLDLKNERKVPFDEVWKTSQSLNCPYFEVSALTGEGITLFRERLIRDLLVVKLETLRRMLHDGE